MCVRVCVCERERERKREREKERERLNSCLSQTLTQELLMFVTTDVTGLNVVSDKRVTV